MNWLEHWILTLTIFVPTAGAVLIALTEARHVRVIRALALTASLVSLVLAGLVVGGFLACGPSSGYLLEQSVLWIGPPVFPAVEIRYHLGVDGLSVFLLALTALLLPLAIAGSFRSISERQKEYFILLLILGSACMGVFCAVDLLLFYIFFEFTLVPLYFLIGIWGSDQRRAAANKFFIYTMAGSVLMFAGVLYLALKTAGQGGPIRFDIPTLASLAPAGLIDVDTQYWLFLALFAGFAIKVPLFPLHTWLPLAHTEAPTAGSVILAGVLLKLGTYGFLRLCLPILPQAALGLAPLMAALAVVAILWGALAAWAQNDFKRLVAYSSVSHMGFCMLGLFTIRPVGVAGSLLYMLNHGISTAALFFVVGMIYDRYHTRRMSEVSGLASAMPRLTAFAVLFALSSIALPGLNGFVSEFMVLVGAFTSARPTDNLPAGPVPLSYAIAAAGGVVLSAIYMLYFLRRVFFGQTTRLAPTKSDLPADLTCREISLLAPLAVLVVLLGLWPGPVIRAIMPACTALTQKIGMPIVTKAPQPTRAEEEQTLRHVTYGVSPEDSHTDEAIKHGIHHP